ESLRQYLHTFLNDAQVEFDDLIWSQDVCNRFKEFSTAGKMMRGCLAMVGAELFGLSAEQVLPLAAAMECMQSSGLIHDDISDHDWVRRGKPSIFAQYQSLADERGYKGERLGESLAIWVGDIGFFLAFKLLGKLSLSSQVSQRLITAFADE